MKAPYVLGAILGLSGLASKNIPVQTLEDVAGFTQMAESLSGYSAHGKLPTVVFMDDAAMRAMYCAGRSVPTENCSVAGLYRTGSVVFVNRDMEQREIDATVVHEIVHYLQFVNGNFRSRCQAEFEANKAEWAYHAVMHGSLEEFHFNRDWYNC